MGRLFITAGGTRAYWDEVRYIGNISTGRFGSRLAKAALSAGQEVIYLHAKDAQTPFGVEVDLRQFDAEENKQLLEQAADWKVWQTRFTSLVFRDWKEYGAQLEAQILQHKPDMVLLSAAVSDYAPTERTGKIPSDQPTVFLPLERTPKFIAQVRTWVPELFLVGFKLMANASEVELVKVAQLANQTNRSDVTIANDTKSIREGNHTVFLVRHDGHVERRSERDPGPPLAHWVIERLLTWWTESKAKGLKMP
jgi:phosphopantothenoylcysteine synthetase/decarboxylase